MNIFIYSIHKREATFNLGSIPFHQATNIRNEQIELLSTSSSHIFPTRMISPIISSERIVQHIRQQKFNLATSMIQTVSTGSRSCSKVATVGAVLRFRTKPIPARTFCPTCPHGSLRCFSFRSTISFSLLYCKAKQVCAFG